MAGSELWSDPGDYVCAFDKMAASKWMTVRLIIFVLMMVSAILFRAFDRMAGSDDGQTSAIMFELLAEWPEASG